MAQTAGCGASLPSLPLPRDCLDAADQQGMMTIYLFIKNYVSATPGGSKIEPIDNKIERAMDLVKSHLLLAVREEVDVLKASISQLVDKISVLERENRVLKTNASPEVLAQLGQSPRNASLRQGAARRPLQAPAAAPAATTGTPRQTRPATP